MRGYRGADSPATDSVLRKRVGAGGRRDEPSTGPAGARPAPSRSASGGTSYDPASEGERAPGHEESGGYVDVDDHRY